MNMGAESGLPRVRYGAPLSLAWAGAGTIVAAGGFANNMPIILHAEAADLCV